MPGGGKGSASSFLCPDHVCACLTFCPTVPVPVSQAVKKPGHEADTAPPASAEVKNA